MAGKRKKSGQRGPSGPKEFNEKDAKIGNISTFEDVADSEDEFHIQRDKVMLDDGPQAKRQRKYAEEGTLSVAAISEPEANSPQTPSYRTPRTRS